MTGEGLNNLDVNLVASILGAVAAAVAVVFLGGAALIGLLIIIIAITFRQVALMLPSNRLADCPSPIHAA